MSKEGLNPAPYEPRKPYIHADPEVTLFKGRTFYVQETPYRNGDTVIRTNEEHGINLEYDALRKLRKFAAKYWRSKMWLNPFTSRQKSREDQLKKLAQENPGLRGMQSEVDNFIVNITPRDPKKTYDVEKLREGLGRFYPSIVSGEMIFSIPISETETNEDIIDFEDALTEALMRRGIDEETAKSMVFHRADVEVNETKLEKYLKHGKVNLPKGAVNQPKTVWHIDSDYLHKPPKKS